MAKILVIVEKGEVSYGAYSPDVPGCVAVGDTREEVLQRFREALREHLELMRDEHLPPPESQASAEYIDIPLSAWCCNRK
jgi:predicted RNase H-like HicB family nuclease